MHPSFGNPVPSSLVRRGEYLELSWELFGEFCRALAMKVGSQYAPELVVGIARAGVIPGAVLASMLRVEFRSMTISRRAGADTVRERPEILSAAPSEAREKRVIVVDEVCTSGETFRMALAALRGAGAAQIRTAAAFTRPGGFAPDFYARQTDATVIFPWDRKILEGGQWVVNPRYENVIVG
jgi:hypoxanthine phosphoribosyltransferase